MTNYSASFEDAQQIFSSPAIGHNNPPFDFIEFVRAVLLSSASTTQKLLSVSIGLKAHDEQGTAKSSRSELAQQASCSEATVKRSYRVLEEFFSINSRSGKTTEYTPKSITTSDVETAIRGLNQSKGAHGDPGRGDPGAHKVGHSVTRGSQSRALSDPGLKKEPPHTPQEKNINIYNTLPTTELREGVGGSEIEGINGATSLIINKLAGWINPMMPDHKTAKGWLENSVALYGATVVRDSFAEVDAKAMHGDIIARPIPLLTKICQRRSEQRPKRSNSGLPSEKPPRMSEKIWAKLKEDEARAKANGGVAPLW